MKIGVILESFRTDFVKSVRQAAALGASGVQIYANTSTLNENISRSDIEKIRSVIEGEGLCISALCGDFGCDMYYTRDRAQIDREKRIMDIAKELGTDIVTTHIGVVPDTENCAQYESMHEVCYELAQYADSVKGHFAVETGPEKATALKNFLDKLNSRGVAVNLDPANLVMCAGDDPVSAVHILKDYIVHTHAKDGVMLKKCDTRALYAPAYFGLRQLNWGEHIEERPLGKGDVSWGKYLDALKEIGYDGFLTIERECGDTPYEDISAAVSFLKKQLGE